jgi:hypothetical protein
VTSQPALDIAMPGLMKWITTWSIVLSSAVISGFVVVAVTFIYLVAAAELMKTHDAVGRVVWISAAACGTLILFATNLSILSTARYLRGNSP